ncbi:hypothetical protein ACTA71_005263 [Dictyostelium dimigraforme]
MILNKIQLLLFFIFSLIIGCYSVTPIVAAEYGCMVNLIENFNLVKIVKDNSTGIYSNLCMTLITDITCWGNYIQKLVLNSGGSENVLYPSNFSTCFPFMDQLTISNLKVSPDFIYFDFTGIQNARYTNITGIVGGITQPLPSFNVFILYSTDLDGTMFRMEYINKITYTLDLSYSGINLYLNSDGANIDSSLKNFYINVYSLATFSNYNFSHLRLSFSPTFDYSTIHFIKTVSGNQLTLYNTYSESSIDQYLFDNTRLSSVYLSAKLKTPTQYFDIASFVNHTYSRLNIVPGTLFQINGSFPMIVPSNLELTFISGALTVFPNYLKFNPYLTTSFISSIKTSQFPNFLGSGGSYDFTGNKFNGTIDSSWCTTEISLSAGDLTGEIPSCYACYLNVTSFNNYSKLQQKSMMIRLGNNKFSNYNKGTPCTTFRPKVELIDDGIFNKVMVTGNDIGFDVTLWKINSTISLDPTTYVINQNGKNYTATMVGANLKDVEYFSVLFTIPNNVLYTFPSNYNIPPIIKSVLIKNTDQIQVSGTHFSSYLQFTNQQIQIQNIGICSTITSSNFFGTQCTMENGKQLPITNSTNPLQIISIEKDSFNIKAYIKIQSNFDNNLVCQNDCSTSIGINSICDLSTGTCKCLPGFVGSDCLGTECSVPDCLGNGYCNYTIGECICDSLHQGSDCSLPFIQCPISSSLPCNGGSNNCNNQTGICTCDSLHQGSDCSLPLIQCPISNSSPCNGGLNNCNNQTGVCTCDSLHQGSDCSLPFFQCPISSALPCNGGSNNCNNQTGVCTCDSSHQGSDCSLPFIQCPISNSSPCNGGLNTCNNQTGVCTCDSSHQGSDCAVPFIECPISGALPCSGGLNVCNNQTGICKCGPSNQGNDCSLPFVSCDPMDCNLNGICDTIKGQCNCKENVWSGPSCLIPYHYITSSIPSTTNGGLASFIGFFGNVHYNPSVTIGDLPCPILNQSSTILNCIAPPGFGTKVVIFTQNNISYSYDKYQYLNINNQTCPNKCSNQGTCNTSNGQCKCNSGYNGADCSGIINPGGGNNEGSNSDGNGGNNGNPPTDTGVDPDSGNTTISNQEVQFQIFFKTLYEIDFNGDIIQTYSLQNNWTTNSTNGENEIVYTLSQTIQNNCSVISKIEEITNRNGKEFTFADETFNLEYGSIKFSIGIYNYSYKNNLNTLKLELVSSVDQSVSDENECNEMDTSIDTINNQNGESTFNYIKISKNNKILEGRFINKLISDGRSTYLSTSMKNENKDSITISLNLPHCVESCIIDPDFSVLISSEFKNKCDNSKDERKAYVIPVAVVVSVVGASAIGAISYLIYQDFNLLKFTKDNTTNQYVDICATKKTDILCTGQLSIKTLVLNSGGTENVLSPSNFATCFPSVDELIVKNLKVSSDFIYYKFSIAQTVRYSNITGIVGITQPLPAYRLIELNSVDLNNKILRMQYINKATYTLDLLNADVYLYLDTVGANLDGDSILTNFYLNLNNFADLSSYKNLRSVRIKFSSTFDYSTISTLKKLSMTSQLSTLSIYDIYNKNATIGQYVFDNSRIPYIFISANFTQPSEYFDITSFKNHTYKTIRMFPGILFHVNGSFPLIVPKDIEITVLDGSLTVFPNNLNFSPYITTSFLNTIKTSPFPSFLGSGGSYDFSGNTRFSGTIDGSWCTTEITIPAGDLTGEIPSCYACYLNVTSFNNYSKLQQKSMMIRLGNNKFSNYNKGTPCTTFRPKVELIDDGIFNKVMVTGNDIGFDVTLWKINSTISLDPTTYVINQNGKNYTATMVGANLKDVEYFSVLFTIPNNVLYTFPSNYNIPPIIKSVLIKNTDQIQVSGTHFSSYLQFTNQQIQIQNIGICSTITSSNFFGTQCTMENGKQLPITNSTNPLQIISIEKDSFNIKAYIKIQSNFDNNLVCQNDCSTSIGINSICDLSTGTCKCLPGFVGSDCLGIECSVPDCLGNGYCNNTVGECICDSLHQGSDCSLPLIQCPISSSLPCNGGSNNCNNQTGICTCDESHQGSDCSLPLIQCPISNSSPCNGGLNNCNNQTGVCTCDSLHQGSDCSLPFFQCPTSGALPCNGGSNNCNNQTGVCTCDSSHQGSDCSLPFIECPISNSSPCNGGLNTCNNQTGICTCDSSHQGSDCSLPFIPCPTFKSLPCGGGLNVCNNQTGICKCGPSNQGNDCSLPFVSCDPMDCNLNGICDTIKGQCNCKENVWSGSSCLIPYHYITSSFPSTTNGGLASFIGFFGNVHYNPSVTIGDLPCPILNQSSTILNCIAPPGFGTKVVIFTQNNISYSYNKYQYLNINNQTCPNKCSNQGTCNTSNGQCKCNSGYNGADCSGIINPGGGDEGNNGNPPTDTGVDPDSGNTTISNQEVQFQIFFKTLYEIDFNGDIIQTYSLQNNWTTNSTNGENEIVYTLSQTIQNNCSVISKIEEITNRNGKEFTFADETFNLEYGSIKFSIGIYNYSYKNNLNTLKLELVSSVDQSVSDENECNEMDTSIDTINNQNGESTFNYIKISKNNKILEGRFINKLISDGRSTYLSTSMKNENKDSITISLNLPHCVESCIIDPDFSVLISSEFKNKCDNSKDERKAYVIPVAVVVSVVGVCAIGAISYLIYRRKTEKNLLIRLTKLNNK